MLRQNRCYLIANFGGPRNCQEIEIFLRALLTDKEVIRSPFPQLVHNIFFSWVAKQRALKVLPEYESMGGGSPIYEYTETFAQILKEKLASPTIPFHRYLPQTHETFIRKICNVECNEIHVFPLFPQFTYSTTGSISKWFKKYLPDEVVRKMRWVKSYAAHPSFIKTYQKSIRSFLVQNQLSDENTILLFSAHGVPQKFVDEGDVYQKECEDSFEYVMATFPKILGRLCYQSRFGKEEWIKPYTIDLCKTIKKWHQGKEHIVFIPISFTSDHIETLCEVERDYMSEIRNRGLHAYRMPALNLCPEWIEASLEILQGTNFCSNQMMVRN